MTTPTTAGQGMTRGDRLTGFLALVLLIALALRGVELGWPTGLTVLVILGAVLAVTAPVIHLINRRRAARVR